MNGNDFDPNFRTTLEKLVEDASHYFDLAKDALGSEEFGSYYSSGSKDKYWNDLPDVLQNEAKTLIDRIVSFASQVVPILRASSLSSDGDQNDLKICIKEMRSALMLRRFINWETEILHNEGEILGIRPAGQSDDRPLQPSDAKQTFVRSSEQFFEILQLAEAGNSLESPSVGSPLSTLKSATRYRPGTAFIMMSMDPSNPALDDIHDTVVDVFRQFKIRANRADDIEHEGIITQRVLREIETSEFLFADLTGQRPNVYYEVGYAHALKKSVILYRNEDATIHFDLAGYNCPTYKNQRDLRQLLTKRLEAITNKSLEPQDDSGQ